MIEFRGEGWQKRKVEIGPFESLLKQWVKGKEKDLEDPSIQEQVKNFIRFYNEAIDRASRGDEGEDLKKDYFRALECREIVAEGKIKSHEIDDEIRSFLWLTAEQMEEWKKALQDQGILVVN